MSTLKMQESMPDDEFTKLRQQAINKDIRYATLENELLKKNNDLMSVKAALNETLGKLREEADRVIKLESDLNRQTEDLRAERLNRQNLEASLTSASEKLASEEQSAKYLQMELDSYASRMSSQHEIELKRLQHEKSTLEARVRTFETHSQASKSSQLPTRLPRPTTFSGAASTALEARIATLESELSTTRLELADTSHSLAAARQEAAKVPRLQSDLIAADNARLRAERDASTQKANVQDAFEQLKERDEELEYWRDTAGERSLNEGKLEDALKERDEAVRSEEAALKCETALRKRIQELEESEAELVIGREEALNELHRLQVEFPADAKTTEAVIAELRSTLAERESALLNARGFASELQQMYRETLNACDSAEARVRNLELQLHPASPDLPPLVIVSPPPSSTAPKPFLAQPKPMSRMSPEDEAVVARLLSAVERLRGERDALRRDLHFVKVEHRIADDALRARLEATEREVHRLEKLAASSQETVERRSAEGTDELRRLQHELDTWREKFERADAELTDRTAELANNDVEMDIMRVHLREVEDDRDKSISSYRESSRVTISSLIAVQHLKSELDDADDRLTQLHQISHKPPITQETLRAELDASNARFADAIKELEQRDIQITDMHSNLFQFESQITGLKCELSEAREEQNITDMGYSARQCPLDDDGGAEGLKSQLEELEQRILRRTEQIGMLQHDIKRLETNLRVAEETIGELTTEVETLGQERACLVDDCAQAREARDEAHRRIDELELELESLTDHRDELEDTKAALQNVRAEVVTSTTSLETMVHVFAESVARSRHLHAALKGSRTRLEAVEANANLAEDRHSRALAEIEHLSSEVDSMAVTIRSKTADMDALTEELNSAKQETQRLSMAMECLKSEAQSREQDLTGETQQHTATIERLEGRLAAAEESKDALSRLLEAAQLKEEGIQAKLEQVQGESQQVIQEVRELTSTVALLEQELNQERVSHSETITMAQENFEKETSLLEARAEESRQQYLSLQAEHANVVRELTCRLEETKSQLVKALEDATSRESLEIDLRRLESEHAEELVVLRSRLDESIGRADSLHAQVQAAAETIKDLQFELAATVERYDAAQVEIHGLEHALAGARTHVDEHDASIEALQREKTALQVEHTRLEAELDRMATKHQYVEQQAKRSDHEIVRLKSEVERLGGEVAKLDEAAQTAEISLSFKTNQYEQKLAMMQRELQRQQSHRHCQESIAELNEKNEYLEEMLRMKSVEIEDNDDRFIDALKEKKRLTSKVDSLTRKVQSLQTKLAGLIAPPSSTSTPPLPTPKPKTPSPPLSQSIPSAGPSSQLPTRIPSSPAAALRAKTPEPSRKAFASRMATAEPPVPSLPNVTYKTPSRPASRVDTHRPADAASLFSHAKPASPTPLSSGSRKRRAPDDFDSPAPGPAEAMVASIDNTTPRRIRRPTSDGRSGFTPTRNNITTASQRPMLQQPSPLRRSIVPLTETTNSPRGSKPIGLGRPGSISKPQMRSWLSRTRAPGATNGETRTSILDVQP